MARSTNNQGSRTARDGHGGTYDYHGPQRDTRAIRSPEIPRWEPKSCMDMVRVAPRRTNDGARGLTWEIG